MHGSLRSHHHSSRLHPVVPVLGRVLDSETVVHIALHWDCVLISCCSVAPLGTIDTQPLWYGMLHLLGPFSQAIFNVSTLAKHSDTRLGIMDAHIATYMGAVLWPLIFRPTHVVVLRRPITCRAHPQTTLTRCSALTSGHYNLGPKQRGASTYVGRKCGCLYRDGVR